MDISTRGSLTRRAVLSGTAAVAVDLLTAPARAASPLAIVVTSRLQVNGVAAAEDGRIFVSMPRWIDADTFSVGLAKADGSLTPYPGGSWNATNTGGAPAETFICVNAVHIDPLQPRRLWVVDAAAPSFGPTVSGGPKLVAIDLATDRVVRTYPLGPDIVPTKGYLNDVRFARGHAFLTESGTGAIIAVDLESGTARRLLADSSSTKAVEGRDPVVDGRGIIAPDGQVPKIDADGIALSPDRDWLLYAVPFGGWLWRVRVADLLDETLAGQALAARVERLGSLMAIGGMTAARDGGLLLSDVEHHAIVHRAPDGTLVTVATDPLLQWPDASALDPAGALLVAVSQVNHMPAFNAGVDAVTRPFHVVKVAIA